MHIQINQSGGYDRTLPSGNHAFSPTVFQPAHTLTPEQMAEFRVAPLVVAPKPNYDEDTEVVRQLEPALQGDQWVQGWQVQPLSPEEIEQRRKAKVPARVTMRQARLALLGAGLLGNVDTAVNALPSPQKEAARIEWEYSQEVQRHNGFVSVLAPALGLSDLQIDQLFVTAGGL